MKEQYVAPEMELVYFEAEDVITSSRDELDYLDPIG